MSHTNCRSLVLLGSGLAVSLLMLPGALAQTAANSQPAAAPNSTSVPPDAAPSASPKSDPPSAAASSITSAPGIENAAVTPPAASASAATPAPGVQRAPATPPAGTLAVPGSSLVAARSLPETAPPVLAPEPESAPQASAITGKLYGFIESRFNATTSEPNGNIKADGSASRSPAVNDLSIPSFHIMAQGTLYDRYRYYINLAAPDSDAPSADVALGVRNAWLEMSILGDYLQLRVGKLYRRFGLYNEILDTVPSFIGVEMPVFLSGNRPMLTRTTNAMVHGRVSFDRSTIAYAVTVGKDEISPNDNVWSPGFDVNYDYDSTLLIGTSFYTTAGKVTPNVTLGQGSPTGGVAPWMKQDSFQVFGGYAQLSLGDFVLHGEAWVSPHKAVRDPELVAILAQNARNFSAANATQLAGTSANYTYQTFDIRASYTFDVGSGDDPAQIIPYLDYQYIRNRESIADTVYGGDGQPGESPQGRAMHNRIGVVIRPVSVVAFKAEGTYAMYDYGTRFASDEELWLSLSYQWELIH